MRSPHLRGRLIRDGDGQERESSPRTRWRNGTCTSRGSTMRPVVEHSFARDGARARGTWIRRLAQRRRPGAGGRTRGTAEPECSGPAPKPRLARFEAGDAAEPGCAVAATGPEYTYPACGTTRAAAPWAFSGMGAPASRSSTIRFSSPGTGRIERSRHGGDYRKRGHCVLRVTGRLRAPHTPGESSKTPGQRAPQWRQRPSGPSCHAVISYQSRPMSAARRAGGALPFPS